MIAEGYMKKGRPMNTVRKQHNPRTVTQKDIAQRAGVSTALVSHVMNNTPAPVAEETRQRILQAIKELGYRPNKHAQRLRSKNGIANRQLGILIGGKGEVLMYPYYGDILFGIYEEAYRQGQRIRFVHFLEELHDPVLLNEYIHPEEISGIILLAPDRSPASPENQAIVTQIVDRIENVVCLEQTIVNVPAVIFDRADAARTAVTHLIRLGHQRIGYIGNLDERLTGYRQTLLDHGLPYDESFVRHPGTRNISSEGYQGAVELLDIAPRPTAIFATCDTVAIGVLGALHDRNVNVPDDIAVVSIDDLDVAANVRPALTTVRIPRRQLGAYALHVLAMHRDHPEITPASMVLPTELIVRQSCGAKKGS
jgi:LacI family transcriptional regulator